MKNENRSQESGARRNSGAFIMKCMLSFFFWLLAPDSWLPAFYNP
jgi:hypothetical protein